MTDSKIEKRFAEARRIPRGDSVHDDAGRLRRIQRLEWLLDRSIPVGKWRVGLDPIIGLIPGVGDWLGAALSFYFLYEAARLGLRGDVLARMTGNILVETIVGAVPVLGDLFDFGWKANTRNVALIHRHYRPGLKPRSLDWVVAAIAVVAFVVLFVVGALGYWAVKGIVMLFAA